MEEPDRDVTSGRCKGAHACLPHDDGAPTPHDALTRRGSISKCVKASLSGIVQEMQNSLFRTGFSTIVRESQDASCALMNARGDVVAQHVVLPLHIGAFPACTAAVIDAFRRRHRAGRRVHHQPSLSRRQPARAGHRGDHAGLHRRRAVRLLRLDRAQERHRRPGAGKLLRPGAGDFQRRPAPAGRPLPKRLSAHRRHRAAHRRQQPHARTRARRHPRAARRRPAGREAPQRTGRQIRPGQDPRLLRPPAGDVGSKAQGGDCGMGGRPLRGGAVRRR